MCSFANFTDHNILWCTGDSSQKRRKYLSVLEYGLLFGIGGYICNISGFQYTESGICKFCHFLTKTQYVVFRKKVSHFILRFVLDLSCVLAIIKGHIFQGGSIDMLNIKKRDGSIVPFNLNKIKVAIEKAFTAVNKSFSDDIIDMLALRVTATFNDKVKGDVVSVEDIQDSVEVVLIQSGYVEVAKAYILYRKQHEKLREMNSTMLDYKNTVNNYLKINDWRVKENSTVTYSVGGLILSNSGAVTANYWLSEIYDEEIAKAHREAQIHIHVLSMLTGYCAGWSLRKLIKEGLGGIPGKITSSPASHLSTLCNQMVNFLGIMQNEWAGAQAFSSFDTYLAPFVKVDNLSYKEVKQCIQSFIYGVNTPSRWGTQAPFTNITLDWVVPNDLAELPAIVGGKEMDFKYKDCVEEMAMVNKAFIEIMIEGDANGRGFQYPIPTYSITRDFDWSNTENNRLLITMPAKYGTPYFSNYINSEMEPNAVRSMC